MYAYANQKQIPRTRCRMGSPDPTESNELKYDELTSLIQVLEKKIHYLETRAGHLAVADLIIQGITCNQALQPSSAAVLRDKWWVPLCLSASVFVAFFLTFAATVRDCLAAKRQRDAIFVDQHGLYREMFAIGNRERQKDSTSAASGRRRLVKAFECVRYKRCAYAGVVSVALLVCNALVMYALYLISRAT